jgi:hypothetical protein
MRISGTNIVTFTLLRFRSKPKTTIALKWQQVANGNWVSVDRGASVDIYQSEITTYGTETEINNIINQFEANRQGGTNYFTIDQFNGVDDQLFGADIDYSSTLNVTVVKFKKRRQKNFKVFKFDFTLQLTSTYSYSGTPSLPSLKVQIGYTGSSNWDIDKQDSYSNSFTYIDHNADIGILQGTLLMTQTEMKAFKRYIMSTIRGGNMVISSIGGVTYPFGPKRGTYPITVKVLDIQEELININRWSVKFKFAEVV